MAKRKLLLPNVAYKRVINPTSNLKPALQVEGGTINVYNKIKISLSEKPPETKDDMVLDCASPIEPDTRPIGTLSDFFLYEVETGAPIVIGINLVE